MKIRCYLFAGAALVALMPQAASSQTTSTPAPIEPAIAAQPQASTRVEDVIVTGAARPRRRLTTSTSVSAIDAKEIAKIAPMGSADLLRNIPGIRAESSGGEGNANIAVRGLPVASGGAKFIQFQEDGLPVLIFGDIAFATADTLVRPDYNVQRVEVLRGGSASTFTSNAPGAVINFISKTGDVAGGTIGLTRGLDFRRSRVDADYGAPIGENWTFHVGGFYRIGDGLKDVGYDAERGGQVKANVTRKFDNGYIRVNFKYLDDRSPTYLPAPVRVTGTASDPTYRSFPGFDIRSGVTQSPYFRADVSVGHDGNRISSDLGDGYRVKSRGGGAEVSFDLGGGFNVNNKFNIASNSNSGGFVGAYPARVAPASTFINELGGAGATLRYATGPNAGQTISNPGALNGNGLAINALTFNVTLKDLTTATNIFSLSREFSNSLGSGSIAFGYFKSYQKINMDWHWNSYLEEAKGNKAGLLDVYTAAGQPVTQNGLIAYGEPVFGNCCQRYYDVDYNIDAPYLGANIKVGNLIVGGSVRYNSSSARGFYASNSTLSVIDVNQDGIIQTPERTVPVVDLRASKPVDYSQKYWTYSVGANYEIIKDLALFGRVSRGARFNADRLLFGGGIRADGTVADKIAVNFVNQQEVGLKTFYGPLSANITAFHATTAEANELTIPKQMLIDNSYESYGVEFEGGVSYGIFRLIGGATYTRARITKSGVNPALKGNIPFRQADWIFQATPSISVGRFELGGNITGSTSSFASDVNTLKLPGYVVTNAFTSFALTPAIRLSLSAQNLFNVIAITEVGQVQDAVPADGINTARTFPGRNVSASITYRF